MRSKWRFIIWPLPSALGRCMRSKLHRQYHRSLNSDATVKFNSHMRDFDVIVLDCIRAARSGMIRLLFLTALETF